MPLSIRLDVQTQRLVERLAREKKQTKSQVLREALHTFTKDLGKPTPRRAYESISDLIGCVRGGPSDRSSRTGEKFSRLLHERRK